MKTLCTPKALALAMILMLVAMLAAISPRVLAGPRPQVKVDPQVVARLAQLLERSGYTYKKAADNVWVVTFKGNVNIFVTSAENLVVMGAVVEPKSSMKVGPEMMFKLLRLVHDIDRVKIGFDDDEDLFLRAEVTARCLDVEEFKSNMEQIAAGVDKVRAAIKSYLVK